MKFPPKPTYRELLLDPRWQKKRLETLDAHSWACDNCAAVDRTLHVHHKVYWPGCAPWDYEDAWLSVLCEKCHEDQTASDKEDRASYVECGEDPDFHKRIFAALPTFLSPADTEDILMELGHLDYSMHKAGAPAGVFGVLHRITGSKIPKILVIACELQDKGRRGATITRQIEDYLAEAIIECGKREKGDE